MRDDHGVHAQSSLSWPGEETRPSVDAASMRDAVPRKLCRLAFLILSSGECCRSDGSPTTQWGAGHPPTVWSAHHGSYTEAWLHHALAAQSVL